MAFSGAWSGTAMSQKKLGHFITTSVSNKVAKVILNKMAKVHFTEWPQEYLISQST